MKKPISGNLKKRDGLQITIAAFPSQNIKLEQEFSLIKAALLYADRIKVFSPTATSIKMISNMENLPPSLQIKFFERVTPITAEKEDSEKLLSFLSAYKSLSNKKQLNKNELILRSQIEKKFKQHWGLFDEFIQKMVEESKIKELDKLSKLGILNWHVFKGTNTRDSAVDFMAECVEIAVSGHRRNIQKNNQNALVSEFIEQIVKTIQDNSTYPLFDTQVDSLVRTSIRANVIRPSEQGIERGRHVGLAKSLFDHLPLFEHATIDEILDIRNELESPLIRFRKAMIIYSENIKPASWDRDFVYDAEKVFHRDVEPALLEIEESIKSNKYLAELTRKFMDKPLTIVPGSLISIAMANFTSLPQEIALSLGIGITSLAIVYDAYEEWLRKQKITEQNLLYFYYKTHKKLE